MPLLFWDASALAKRYRPEIGTPTVHALFALAPPAQMLATVVGYAETFSMLLRNRNSGAISASTFVSAKTLLRAEVVDDPAFVLLTIDDAAIFAGISLMEQYNVNASDSSILAVFLRYIQTLPAGSLTPVLLASDQRLIVAAKAEGLAALDPEAVAAADVPAFLSGL